MEERIPENFLIRELAARYRVILVGGMAVIGHGLARRTKDYDIWLEPMKSAEEWAMALVSACAAHPEARFWSLAQKRNLNPTEIEAEVEEAKVVRMTGLNLPVDVFRCPNEMEVEDFDSVWNRASVMEDNVALPDPVDLYLTKVETGREQDWQDQIYLDRNRFLESPVHQLPELLFGVVGGESLHPNGQGALLGINESLIPPQGQASEPLCGVWPDVPQARPTGSRRTDGTGLGGSPPPLRSCPVPYRQKYPLEKRSGVA